MHEKYTLEIRKIQVSLKTRSLSSPYIISLPTEELQIWPKSPVRWPQQVRSATRDSQVGLRAFAPHDLYLLPGSNHGPCRTWLGLGGGCKNWVRDGMDAECAVVQRRRWLHMRLLQATRICWAISDQQNNFSIQIQYRAASWWW